MQAALITGARQIDRIGFPEPVTAEGAAVMRVDLCGICGTNVSSAVSVCRAARHTTASPDGSSYASVADTALRRSIGEFSF